MISAYRLEVLQRIYRCGGVTGQGERWTAGGCGVEAVDVRFLLRAGLIEPDSKRRSGRLTPTTKAYQLSRSVERAKYTHAPRVGRDVTYRVIQCGGGYGRGLIIEATPLTALAVPYARHQTEGRPVVAGSRARLSAVSPRSSWTLMPASPAQAGPSGR